MRYTRPQNAHLRQVNSAFSDIVSLKIPHFIHVRVSTGAVTTILVGQLFFLRFFKLRLPKNLSCYKTSTGSKGIQFRLDTFFVQNNIINTSFPGGVADDGNLPFTSNEIALSVVTLLAMAY